MPYIAMRVFCALTGLLVVPIAYFTMRGAGHSVAAGLVAASMVCFGKKSNREYVSLELTLV